MYLVQLLLPVQDNNGHEYGESVLRGVSQELIAKFGGLTAYSRSPAKGVWFNADRAQRDDIIIVEVMTGKVDREWWSAFRLNLERTLEQKEIVIRTYPIDQL